MTILDRLHAPRPAGLRVMLVMLVISVSVTLAHSSPPDQTWIAGVYDQADFDDVVGFLTSALEATDSTVAPDPSPRLVLKPHLCLAAVASLVSAPAYSPPLRAPPLA